MLQKKTKKPRQLPSKPHLDLEKALRQEGFRFVAGVDEAGRGAWAGPLMAGAVILPEECSLLEVNDSKLLAPKMRRLILDDICSQAIAFAVGRVEAWEIDNLGLARANVLAMERALKALAVRPDYVLVDGYDTSFSLASSSSVIKGDRISLSIAAASILAKVTRDSVMEELDVSYPDYQFGRHKGYGTEFHRKALAEKGPTKEHRKSFAPISKLQSYGPRV